MLHITVKGAHGGHSARQSELADFADPQQLPIGPPDIYCVFHKVLMV